MDKLRLASHNLQDVSNWIQKVNTEDAKCQGRWCVRRVRRCCARGVPADARVPLALLRALTKVRPHPMLAYHREERYIRRHMLDRFGTFPNATDYLKARMAEKLASQEFVQQKRQKA